MNPPKIIKPTLTTPTLDLNYFKNNPTPVPLGTSPITSSTTQGSTPTNPGSTSTIIDGTSTTVDEENISTDIITAMLAIYKFVNRNKTTGQNVQILPTDGSINDVGILLTNDSSETITILPTKYTFVATVTISGTKNDYGTGYVATYKTSGKYKITSKTIEAVNDDQGRASVVEARKKFTSDVKALTLQQYSAAQPVGDLTITPSSPNTTLKIIHGSSFGGGGTISQEERLNSENEKFVSDPLPPQIETKRYSEAPITIDNPLKDFGWNDAFKLLTQPPLPHYIRFGALLEFLLANVLIKIKKTGEPIFKIDHNEWGTYMYSLPNQISLDPRVCIVRNDHIEVGSPDKQTLAFKKLNWFREFDGPDPSKENSALTLNIYLNFDFVTECLKTDDKGNVSVYQFLSNICTGLNKALGGINNLEPVIDETDNTLRIIDTTPIPGHSAADNGPGYILQIYGYDKLGNNFISNFVRKVDLKTAITPEYATMITVGATAGGYVKGTEATAFSKWNTGLTDRFKEEFLPPNGTSANSNEDEADDNYAKVFIEDGYANRYGFTYLGEGMKISDNIIEKNISIVTEYYRWLIAKKSLGDKPSGGTVGFIPFKLGLTLDGISGIKIYNVLRINTEFLPKAYGKTVDLIVTGVSHRLNNNDWETSIESTVMPKTGNTPLSTISVKEVRENVNENVGPSGGINTQNVITDSTGTWIKPAKEGRIGDYVDLSDTINKNKYKDLVNKFSNGIWPVALYYRAGDPTPYGKVVSKVGRRNVYASDPRYDSQLINWSYTGTRSKMKKTATVHQSWEPTLTKMAEYLDKTGLWTDNAVKTWSAGILRRDVTPKSGIQYGQLSGHAFGMAIDINSGIYPLGSGGVKKYNTNIAAGIQSAKVLKFLNENFGKNNYPGANKIFWALKSGDAHHFAINKLV
jgi:hypothetical protein